MKTLLVLVLTLAVLSQVNSTSYNRGSYLSRLFADSTVQESKPSTVSQQTVHPPTPASVSSESSESSTSSTSSTSTESTESTPSEKTPSEETPKEPTPVAPEEPAVTICQPYQKEVNGVCECDNDRCNDFQSSHLCTEESAAGICQCNTNACAKNNLVCSENSLEGNCVECTDDDIQECRNHQTCFLEHCVCIDHMCQDELICEREYSATEICVECRESSDCGDFQICDDFGDCVCRDELCGDNVCSSEDADGVCVECREDSQDNCMGSTSCSADNECVCTSELCPIFSICDQEGPDGECNVAVPCKSSDECFSESICFDVQGDDGDDSLSLQDQLLDNTCTCNENGAGDDLCEALNDDEFTYTCQQDNTLCIVTCPVENRDLADFDDRNAACPENTVCQTGSSICFPVDIPCRNENGLIELGQCPPGFSGCLTASENPAIEISPFCTRMCGGGNQEGLEYPCPAPYDDEWIQTADNDQCLTDPEDDTRNLVACIDVLVEEPAMEEM